MGNKRKLPVLTESLEHRLFLATNDMFADAAVLTGSQATASADISAATTEPGEPGIGSDTVAGIHVTPRTLWWQWKAPQDGAFVVDTAGSDSGVGVGVYTGQTLASLTATPFNAPNGGFLARRGETYRIRASYTDYGTMIPETWRPHKLAKIQIVQTTASSPTSTGFTLRTPTDQPYTFTAADFASRFTPSDGRPLTRITLGSISSQPSEPHDTIIIGGVQPPAPTYGLFYKGVLAQRGTEIPVGEISSLVFQHDATHTYCSFDFWAGDDLRYTVVTSSATVVAADSSPANDNYADRQALIGTDITIPGTLVGATTEIGEPNSFSGATVWYEWTAPYDCVVTLTPNDGRLTTLAFTGDPFQGNHRDPVGYPPYMIARAGETLSIRVAGRGDFALHLTAQRRISIQGTSGDDTISITLQGTDVVVRNNEDETRFPASQLGTSSGRIGDVDFGPISIFAGAGNDRITVGPGLPAALIRAGQGNDTIEGGDGADTIYGGQANDTIHGGKGADYITAGPGDDQVFGDNGPDTLIGGDGNDTLFGGNGHDSLSGNDGDDLIYGGNGNDTISGDTYTPPSEFCILTVSGDTPPATIVTPAVISGSGNDTIYGEAGDDSILAGAGDDQVYGGDGNDTLRGGQGRDYLDGGTGDNSLTGGKGEDTLIGGSGINTILANDGECDWIDTVNFATAKRDDVDHIVPIDLTIDGTQDADRIRLEVFDSATGPELRYTVNDVTITILCHQVRSITVRGFAGDDLIELGTGVPAALIQGGKGNDTIYGGSGNDTIYAGLGDDVVYGDAGDDSIVGGGGDDQLYGDDGDDTLRGGAGRDYLVGGTGNNILIGGRGEDTLIGGSGTNQILANDGDMDWIDFDNFETATKDPGDHFFRA